MLYPHLFLTEWPFNIVPSRESATFLSARSEMSHDIERLLRTMQLRAASSIHLLWAWYGSGKTHTLFYLANQAVQRNIAVPIVVEFDRSYGMLDVYRASIAQLGIEQLEEAFIEAYTSSKLSASFSSDLERALHARITGSHETAVVCDRYLRGEKLTKNEARAIDVSGSIDSPSACVLAIASINRLLSSGSMRRLLFILDEFQRIGESKKSVRDEVASSLHALFNACPTNLTMVLSFSGQPQTSWPDWLTKELADRIGLERTLLLPPLSRTAAADLLKGILSHYRPKDYNGTDVYPFDADALAALIDWVDQHADMKPRSLIQAASLVMEDAEPLIESGALGSISTAHVLQSLKDRTAALTVK